MNEHNRLNAELAQWRGIERPEDCIAKCGDTWTGEVDLDGLTLWFIYRDSNGDLYMSRERPALRLNLTALQYECIPFSKAHEGLPKQPKATGA